MYRSYTFTMIIFSFALIFSGCGEENIETSFLEGMPQTSTERIIQESLPVQDSLLLSERYGILDASGLRMDEENLYIGDRSSVFRIVIIDKATFELQNTIEIPAGSGPGEITGTGRFDVASGYLVISDADLNKVQVWDTDGNFVNEFIKESVSAHRLNVREDSNIFFLSTLLNEQNNLFTLFNMEGDILSSFGAVPTEDFSPLKYSGSTEFDSEGNLYYAGYSEHILKKYDREGNQLYSVASIDNFPGELNYSTFLGGEQTILRYSPHAFHSAIGSTLYRDYWIILHGGAVDERPDHPIIDIYHTDDGQYLHSLTLPYLHGYGQVAVDNDHFYLLHQINEEIYLVMYPNVLDR